MLLSSSTFLAVVEPTFAKQCTSVNWCDGHHAVMLACCNAHFQEAVYHLCVQLHPRLLVVYVVTESS